MTLQRIVRVNSAGRAQDGALLAAADVARVATTLDIDYRLVGGNAVTLLTEAFAVTARVPARETADADFGVSYSLAADPGLLAELLRLGYSRASGNHFTRTVGAPGTEAERTLAIDVLTPSYTGRMESGVPHGELVVDEVPGLQVALAREGVTVRARAYLTNGEELEVGLLLPDPLSALCLKAYAYRGRHEERDAVDVWRLLEVAREAGVTPRDWSDKGAGREVRQILADSFGRPASPGPARATRVRAEQTHIRALVAAVVGST